MSSARMLICEQNFAGKYTFGPDVVNDDWHIEILKRNLTKNLGALFPAMWAQLTRRT
jgi:hypothetical protein